MKGNPWTQDEMEIFSLWLQDAPPITGPTSFTVDLLACLPNRTRQAVYHKWHGLNSTTPINSKKELAERIARAITPLIAPLLTSDQTELKEIQEENSKLKKENIELKALLVELKDVRAACEAFGKQYTRG